jgi:hypothetical protein
MPPSVQRSNAKHYNTHVYTEEGSFPAAPTSARSRLGGSRDYAGVAVEHARA